MFNFFRRRIVNVDKILIVGLGNPGPEHTGNRHNAGFACLNRLAKRHGIALKAGKSAWTGSGRIGEADVLLFKPRTFVNRSGTAVAPVARREGVAAERTIVVFDELDLPEGRIRLRKGGSDGGHNGLKSITAALGSSDYGRVRIGIGRPIVHGAPSWDPEDVADYVLSNPPAAGRKTLDEALDRACDAVETIINEGWERAMNKFNTTG
jgi:peptidyl-tRNA hydrolase, PTH1 family